MSRAIEVTKEQLDERARMAEISSDAEVIEAIKRFDLWAKKERMGVGDAVSQMLIFLRNSLEMGKPLRGELWGRIDEMLSELEDRARDSDPRLKYAVDYLAYGMRTAPEKMDYDPKTIYMMWLISYGDFLFEGNIGDGVMATFNTLFKMTNMNKLLFVFEVKSALEQKSREQLPALNLITEEPEGLEPLQFTVYSSFYNIRYHNDGMGGRCSWQEGEEIALGLYRFITSEKSRGLLCSLIPPTGELIVDWDSNDWLFDPAHQGWAFSEHDQWLRYFDQMAQMKGLVETS